MSNPNPQPATTPSQQRRARFNPLVQTAPTPASSTPSASPLAQLPSRTQPRADRIYTTLPDARSSFRRKYNRPEFQRLQQERPELFNTIARFDAQRVSRGQSVLGDDQTAKALQTVLTGEAATPEEDRGGVQGVLQNTIQDISGMAQGLVRLPGAIIDEAQQIPDLPENIQEAVSTADNPLDAVSNLAQTPVLRFAPGAFVLENLQTPGELLQHPLLTALDVSPYASRAARGSKTFKAAEEAAEQAGKRAPRPLPTVAMNKLDLGGELTPTRIGVAVNAVTSTLGATRAGQFVKALGSDDARQMARMESAFVDQVKDKMEARGLDSSYVDNLARESHRLNTEYNDLIPAETRSELGRVAQLEPEKIPDLPDTHRAYIEEYRRVQDEFAAKVGIDSGHFLAATIDGRQHIFDKSTGKIVLNQQGRVTEISNVNQWRKYAEDAENFNDTTLIARLTDERPRGEAIRDRRGKSLDQTYDKFLVSALDVKGYNVDDAWQAVRDNSTISRDMIGNKRPVVFDDAMQTLRQRQRAGDSIPAQLTTAVTRGDWQTAVQKARSQKVADILGEDNARLFEQDLIARRERARVLRQTDQYSDARLARAQSRLDKVESRAVPAAYQPLVTEQARKALADRVEEVYATDPNLPQLLDRARELNLEPLSQISRGEFRALQRDAALNWRRMARELGEDQPVFVHKVDPRRAGQITSPRIAPGAPALTQARARSLDATPYVRDLSVALKHQTVEWLQRQAADEFMETVGRTWGRTFNDIAGQYQARAQRAAQIRSASTGVPEHTLVVDELNRLVGREWAPHRHDTRIPSVAKEDALFIPKYLSDNIERLAPSKNKITSDFLDPTMAVFRTSVLALSPRWHVYNMLGGSIMLSLEAGPQAFRHAARARQIVRSADKIDPVTGNRIPPGTTQGGMVSMPEDVVRWSKEATPGQKALAFFNFKGGQKARQLFDQARESRLAKAGGTLVQKSYDWNGMVDDWFRTMAYLEGEGNALKRGMSQTQAADAGVGLARKILANWDEMTPIERSVMRYWFPFYGFNSFLLRYVSKYPLDHPARASILSNIARNEIDDMGSGLPQEFLQIFHLTDMDEAGNIKALSTQGINPFSQTADWFKMAGFATGNADFSAITTNLNPVLSTMLEGMGVDTMSGSAELFPDVRVDPDTGRLVATNADFTPGSIAANFVPQAQAVAAMTGFSGQFADMVQNNPDGAGRFLASNLGLPVMVRDMNVPEEQISAELTRQEAQSRARSKALREGNFGLLRDYPGLHEYADVLEELDAQGLLDDLKPPAQQVTNPLRVLQTGLG